HPPAARPKCAGWRRGGLLQGARHLDSAINDSTLAIMYQAQSRQSMSKVSTWGARGCAPLVGCDSRPTSSAGPRERSDDFERSPSPEPRGALPPARLLEAILD